MRAVIGFKSLIFGDSRLGYCNVLVVVDLIYHCLSMTKLKDSPPANSYLFKANFVLT